ncbi:MAG: phenylalanine--tRNA ligase subunit beta [Verrucomicrobiales bacterium]|jgi:phenylalanyl-tRNA synthetase beta chain|nr:phenylalanine--tRNA ligase subunit beta [Verrucomicrobiales bacterium]
MKIVLSWLREHCAWTWSDEELAEKLTMSGTEVESVVKTGFALDNFVAARVLTRDRHPNADKLSVCQVDDGGGVPRQIVCGATNFQVGDVVPLALPGAVMPGGFAIKESKLRGVESRGMLCSAKELELSADSAGLLLLPPDTVPGAPLRELFKGETVFEIEVTPNRADLLSYEGLARELVALGAVPADRDVIKPDGFTVSGSFTVTADAALCPRYTARLLANVSVGPSPDWLRARLAAQGARAVNNVVDVTNYVLFELGQPLHAFDADLLQGNQLTARRAADGERLLALDGREYALTADDTVIADAARPVAIAGVMGGELTGVTARTTRVLLESARFSPSATRRTSRRLALISDSSYRFERGIDPAAVDRALQRAADLLVEIAGAQKTELAVQSAADHASQRVVPLTVTAAPRLLSYTVSAERSAAILTALGCQPVAADGDTTQWRVPSYRPDLTREVDLVEEIARIEGMGRVTGRVPAGVAPRSKADQQFDRERELARALCGWGWQEMATNSLLARHEGLLDGVNLRNPLTADHAALRRDLLATVLPCVRLNLARGAATVKAFELGTIYMSVKGGRLVEQRRLVMVSAGLDQPAGWDTAARAADYYALKGALEALTARFPELKLPKEFGAVSVSELKRHGLKVPVFAAELSLPALKQPGPEQFVPLPNYPAVRRDLAFVVSRNVSHADLLKAIRSVNVSELERVDCFDVFSDPSGVKLPADRKSLAYSLTYRSSERTLTEKDVSGWERRIIEAAKKAGAELRS